MKRPAFIAGTCGAARRTVPDGALTSSGGEERALMGGKRPKRRSHALNGDWDETARELNPAGVRLSSTTRASSLLFFAAIKRRRRTPQLYQNTNYPRFCFV